MNWNESPLEAALQSALQSEFGKEHGDTYYGDYTSARRELLENLLQEIRSAEPDLTDHGPDHIRNVLTNAHELLDAQLKELSAAELYILCVSILFHDVGNFFGRKKHNRRIAEIYNRVRKNEDRFDPERNAVLTIAGAHTGFARDGTRDTLGSVEEKLHVLGKPIRAQQIAALVRFADEFAEGPQRTSYFMSEFNKYSREAKIYHAYARITRHTVDADKERLAVDYHIGLDGDASSLKAQKEYDLTFLLDFVFKRLLKLEEERKYCCFYTGWLAKFREVSATLRFTYDGDYLQLGLPPLVLNDLVVPGSSELNLSDISKSNAKYDTTALIRCIADEVSKL